MKFFLIGVAIVASTLLAFTAEVSAAGSSNVGEPGFYGRLNVSGYPPPRVFYRQPRAIQNVPVDRPAIYLRVRPGHAQQWPRYCNQYNACNERVYFVQHDWYNREYAPRYRKQNLGQPMGERPDYHDNDHGYRNGNNGHGRN